MKCKSCKQEKDIKEFPSLRFSHNDLYQIHTCNNCGNEYRNKRLKEIKEKVFEAYGNKCSCCGESIKEFLALDHVNGGGRYERKVLGWNSQSSYIDAIKRNFPSKYRLLCHNCNLGREKNNGICPHKSLG